MSISMRRAHLEPATAASCILLACTLAAAFGITASYKNRIDASHLRAETMYATTESNRRLIAAEVRLEAERPAALAYIQRVAKAQSASQAMALFLQDVQTSASAANVQVAGVDRVTRVAPQPSPAAASYLGSDAVTLKARGTFAQLLAFEQLFSQRNSLVSVDGIDFAAAPSPQARQTTLTASISATIYHLTAPL